MKPHESTEAIITSTVSVFEPSIKKKKMPCMIQQTNGA
jgi:hypothetical protein